MEYGTDYTLWPIQLGWLIALLILNAIHSWWKKRK